MIFAIKSLMSWKTETQTTTLNNHVYIKAFLPQLLMYFRKNQAYYSQRNHQCSSEKTNCLWTFARDSPSHLAPMSTATLRPSCLDAGTLFSVSRTGLWSHSNHITQKCFMPEKSDFNTVIKKWLLNPLLENLLHLNEVSFRTLMSNIWSFLFCGLHSCFM